MSCLLLQDLDFPGLLLVGGGAFFQLAFQWVFSSFHGAFGHLLCSLLKRSLQLWSMSTSGFRSPSLWGFDWRSGWPSLPQKKSLLIVAQELGLSGGSLALPRPRTWHSKRLETWIVSSPALRCTSEVMIRQVQRSCMDICLEHEALCKQCGVCHLRKSYAHKPLKVVLSFGLPLLVRDCHAPPQVWENQAFTTQAKNRDGGAGQLSAAPLCHQSQHWLVWTCSQKTEVDAQLRPGLFCLEGWSKTPGTLLFNNTNHCFIPSSPLHLWSDDSAGSKKLHGYLFGTWSIMQTMRCLSPQEILRPQAAQSCALFWSATAG